LKAPAKRSPRIADPPLYPPEFCWWPCAGFRRRRRRKASLVPRSLSAGVPLKPGAGSRMPLVAATTSTALADQPSACRRQAWPGHRRRPAPDIRSRGMRRRRRNLRPRPNRLNALDPSARPTALNQGSARWWASTGFEAVNTIGLGIDGRLIVGIVTVSVWRFTQAITFACLVCGEQLLWRSPRRHRPSLFAR